MGSEFQKIWKIYKKFIIADIRPIKRILQGDNIMKLDLRDIPYLCGLLTPIIAYALIFIAISMTQEFSWYHNALSDLGGPLGIRYGANVVFNSGLIIAGILLLIFAIQVLTDFQYLVRKIGAFILLLSAISLTLIGVFPETAGKIHYYVSVAFFITFPFGMLIISTVDIIKREDLVLGIYGVIVFILCAVIWSLPWGMFGVTGVAIPEFLSSLTGSIWIVLFAMKKLLEKRH